MRGMCKTVGSIYPSGRVIGVWSGRVNAEWVLAFGLEASILARSKCRFGGLSGEARTRSFKGCMGKRAEFKMQSDRP